MSAILELERPVAVSDVSFALSQIRNPVLRQYLNQQIGEARSSGDRNAALAILMDLVSNGQDAQIPQRPC